MMKELKAVINEEDLDAAREEMLAAFRRIVSGRDIRCAVRAEKPSCMKRRRAVQAPSPLASPRSATPCPSRFNWELLEPRRRALKERQAGVRTVYSRLPAERVVGEVRRLVEKREISVTLLSETIGVSPKSLRKWLDAPDGMTLGVFRELTRWLNGRAEQAQKGYHP